MKLIDKILGIDKIKNKLEIAIINDEAALNLFITLLIKLKITPEEIVKALNIEQIKEYQKKLIEATLNKLILLSPNREKLDEVFSLKESLLKIIKK